MTALQAPAMVAADHSDALAYAVEVRARLHGAVVESLSGLDSRRFTQYSQCQVFEAAGLRSFLVERARNLNEG